MTIETRLVNLNKMDNVDFAAFRRGDPAFVYIGRTNNVIKLREGKWSLPGQPAFNIVTICKERKCGFHEAREIVNVAYREHVLSTPKLLNSLRDLRGKTLVCSCVPLRCHGHVLIDLLDKYWKDK